MKTATETVQEFLFKDKPKRSYCKKFDVQDLVNSLQNFGNQRFNEGKKEGIEQMRDACIEKGKAIYSRTFDEPFIDTNSIRRIAEEEIEKLLKP